MDRHKQVELEADHDLVDVNMDIDTATQECPTQHVPLIDTGFNISKDIPKQHLVNNLLVMAIKWRRQTTLTIAQDILKLVTISSGTNNANSSKHYWKKILDRSERDCPVQCDKCHKKVDRDANKGTFLHLPLADQLREIFEKTDAHQLYRINREKTNKYAIEHICDGKMYKKYILNETTISINFSVDGAPIFDSSNTSVYPVLCTINELNPHDRRKYVLLSSVWFGVRKPKNMISYLKPFMEEAKTLLKDGFSYTYQGQSFTKTVVTLMGICDSVARSLVRCSTQFNGEFGCGLCLHPGKSVEKGRGHARIYPLVDGNPFGDGRRTHEDTLLHAKASEKKDKKGIKGVSVLCDIPNYDIIKNLDTDWMHCVGLGVCHQFAGLWFDSCNSSEKFYFGNKIAEFDKYITSFSPTSEISSIPQPLADRTHTKAHEWITFLLAYSLPVMKMCFPKQYVDHWALLVDGISILVKASIMKSEIKYADQCLREFILGVELLYGEKYVSFNVHLLADLTISVENWGPLYTHSAFIYEDFNQTIQASVNSPNGVEI
ncbi:Protein of unknown function [Cotesia congregata]|uniref:Transposase domain-containing protein n=1 Tax=Cotesia congregata TaxID=51543 RepID=A0A8J2HGQ7_COTCN|nr:Protein of unknown function [Cotesia congregata]